MQVNEKKLADKLNSGIVNRAEGVSPEEAAKNILPSLSKEENATLVAIAMDTLVKNSQIQPQPSGKYHHG